MFDSIPPDTMPIINPIKEQRAKIPPNILPINKIAKNNKIAITKLSNLILLLLHPRSQSCPPNNQNQSSQPSVYPV